PSPCDRSGRTSSWTRVSCSGRTSVSLTWASLVDGGRGRGGGKPSRIESLRARRLVKAGVVGVRRHVGELAALAAQHRRPQLLRLRAERVGRLGREHVPGALLDLDL